MSIKFYDKSGESPQEKLLAGVPVTDQILNATSKNPIANKAVYNALRDKIDKTVNDLLYYYSKSDVYNKAEVRELIGAIDTLTMEVVSALPVSDISTTTIYLLKQSGSNVYDEYVYISDAWVKIGTTEMDLSGYLTVANFNITIANYYTKAEIDTFIDNFYTKAEIDADFYDKVDMDELLDGKQDALTFDSVPTKESVNPVTSGGVYGSEQDIFKVMGQNGAKNLLPNNGSSETVGSLSFTKNADGSVTINGTNNNGGLVFYKICENIAWGNTELNIGITSFPTEARYGNYLFSLDGDHSVTFTAGQVAFGYTVSNTTTWIAINDGVTVNNLTVYPMIRLASDTDNTFVPYAMTNRELTDTSVTVVALNSTYVNTGTMWYTKRGKQVILNIDNLSITASATQATALNSDKLPKPIANTTYKTRACAWTSKSGGGVALLEVTTSGDFTLGGYLPTALTESCYGQLTYFTNE